MFLSPSVPWAKNLQPLLAWLWYFCQNIEFDEEVLDPEVRVASPEDDHPPGLSLAEVLGGLGPMVLSARQQ